MAQVIDLWALGIGAAGYGLAMEMGDKFIDLLEEYFWAANAGRIFDNSPVPQRALGPIIWRVQF
jgi:hypothetical protein